MLSISAFMTFLQFFTTKDGAEKGTEIFCDKGLFINDTITEGEGGISLNMTNNDMVLVLSK